MRGVDGNGSRRDAGGSLPFCGAVRQDGLPKSDFVLQSKSLSERGMRKARGVPFVV